MASPPGLGPLIQTGYITILQCEYVFFNQPRFPRKTDAEANRPRKTRGSKWLRACGSRRTIQLTERRNSRTARLKRPDHTL